MKTGGGTVHFPTSGSCLDLHLNLVASFNILRLWESFLIIRMVSFLTSDPSLAVVV
jgi:hypothetical protein